MCLKTVNRERSICNRVFCPPARRAQRVEKGVNSEKRAVLHAEKTSRNRAEFRFSRAGAVQRYCPRAKDGKRKCRINTWFMRHLIIFSAVLILQARSFSCCSLFDLIWNINIFARFSRLYRQSDALRRSLHSAFCFYILWLHELMLCAFIPRRMRLSGVRILPHLY